MQQANLASDSTGSDKPIPVYRHRNDEKVVIGYVRFESQGWAAFTTHEVFGHYRTRDMAERTVDHEDCQARARISK